MSKKGAKIKKIMTEKYGSKKGKQVFYASINKGNIKGVEAGNWDKHKSSADYEEHNETECKEKMAKHMAMMKSNRGRSKKR